MCFPVENHWLGRLRPLRVGLLGFLCSAGGESKAPQGSQPTVGSMLVSFRHCDKIPEINTLKGAKGLLWLIMYESMRGWSIVWGLVEKEYIMDWNKTACLMADRSKERQEEPQSQCHFQSYIPMTLTSLKKVLISSNNATQAFEGHLLKSHRGGFWRWGG